MNRSDVLKAMIKSAQVARLDRYCAGNLYYRVEHEGAQYEFPISTIEVDPTSEYYSLSSDLGTTAFSAEMKASLLNRWIGRAVDDGSFVKVN